MKTKAPFRLLVIAVLTGALQLGFAQTPAPQEPQMNPPPPAETQQTKGKKPISFSARSVQGVLAKDKQDTILTGSVKLTTGSRVITAERVELRGEAYGNAAGPGNGSVNDSEKGFSLVAAKLIYQRDTEIGVAQGKVAVNDTKNNTIIDAEWVRFDQQQSVFEAAVSVLVLKEDMSIRAEYAFYNRDTEEIKLHGGAVAITEEGTLKGDVISTSADWSDLQISGEVSGDIKPKEEPPSQ